MNEANLKLARGFVDAEYIKQGAQALQSQQNLLKVLMSQRRLPDAGWSEPTIEYVLTELALMDSNNFPGNVGVGEREARVLSPLVARRHHRLGHGIGRSGDVAAVQPKAAGSSLLNKLTNCLALDALRKAGLTRASGCVVLPMATGMSVALTLLTLRASRPDAKYVLWSRIDQKSCLKAVQTAALIPVAVPLRRDGDELRTDVDAFARLLDELGGPSAVLCALSCTSCFAPRAPDDVEALSALCAARGVAHVVNNAYGVGCSKTMHALNEAMRVGRVDAVVCSTDKNFLVPVGGAIVVSGPGAHGADKKFAAAVAKAYPGRASSSPIVDLFITLLTLGAGGWKALLRKRKDMVPKFRDVLGALAAAEGERLLVTPHNTISFAVTLSSLGGDDGGSKLKPEERVTPPSAPCGATRPADGGADADADAGTEADADAGADAGADGGPGGGGGAGDGAATEVTSEAPPLTYLGSMLFSRAVSGTRIVARGGRKSIAGIDFVGFGSHCDDYGAAYITAACALGMEEQELTIFADRLRKCIALFRKEVKTPSGSGTGTGTGTGTDSKRK